MERSARQSRPQLVCVLADNSGSMYGAKAEAATRGLRDMLLRCQTRGPRGPEKSYFMFVLIRFDDRAELAYDVSPVRRIDPSHVEVKGNGGLTDIAAALELAYEGLQKYMENVIAGHPERSEHPVPLVLLFSDGQHNGEGDPVTIARRIKAFSIEGDPVIIACAGVATDGANQIDEPLLREIASPECYHRIEDARQLRRFLAEVGSSGVSSAAEVSRKMDRAIAHRPGGELT